MLAPNSYTLQCSGNGQNRQDTANVTINDADSIGSLAPVNCSQISGWAGDPDEPTQPTQVEIVAIDIGGGGGWGGPPTPVVIATPTANIPREAAVCTALGGSNCGTCPGGGTQCQHGYSLDVNTVDPAVADLKNGSDWLIAANVIDLVDGDSFLLSNSGQTLTCLPNSTLSGTVIEDLGNQATFDGTYCTLSGPNTGVQPGAGSTISVGTGEFSPVAGDGTYSMTVPGATHLATLSGYDSDWVCSCPAGCSLSVTTPPDETNLNFFVTQIRDKWVQISGGDVHAQLDFSNPLPASCEASGTCNPYTAIRDTLGSANSSGIVSYSGSGAPDFWSEAGDQTRNVSEDVSGRVANPNPFQRQRGYHTFLRSFEMPIQPQNGDFINPSSITKPSAAPINQKAYFNQGDVIIDSAWNVTSGESFTIFIDGALTINQPVTVDPGGFLAFVTSQDITINPNLGQADHTSTDAVVEGIYIADGALNINSANSGKDAKFIGEGTFVGWSGVNLGRDFRGIENNQYPPQLFTYRPDLFLNAPDGFKLTKVYWQELAP